jgi:HAE1 family hydrophobic/amphiphilic exporter-1
VGPVNFLGGALVRLILAFNDWLLQGVFRRIAFTMSIVGLACAATWALWPKVEYLPGGNRNLVFGILLPPPGYNMDQLTEIGQKVEDDLRPYWDVDPDSPEAAKLKYPVIGDFFFVVRGRMVFMGLKAADPTRAAGLIPLVHEVTGDLPGTFAIVNQSSLFEQGLATGRSIDVEITGPQLEQLLDIGRQVMGKVAAAVPGAQAFPRPSLDMSSPEVHVEPRLVQAAEMGIPTAELGYGVNALVDGAYAGDYYLGADKIDLTIKGELQYAQQTQDLATLPIATPGGQLVPLSAVANVELGSGPEQINHRERLRAITIQVSPPPEMALEDAMTRITGQVIAPLRETGQLQGGYMITLAGTADKLNETWRALWFNFALAALITYLLMAALFESWLYPLVIIFTVPLGAIGGILGLALLNLFILQPLDVLTMLGFVILIGTVVNNPILIVHQALLHIREDGMSQRAAVLEATRSRVRPIFMTTITTVLGLLPLVLFPGAGSELYRGLGTVFLGGLVVSTIFTLVLVPALFSLTMEAKELVIRLLFGRRAIPAMAAAEAADGRERPALETREPVTVD